MAKPRVWSANEIEQHKHALTYGLREGSAMVGMRSSSGFLYRCKQMGIHIQLRDIPLSQDLQELIISTSGKHSIRKLALDHNETEDRIATFYKLHGFTSPQADLKAYHRKHLRHDYFDTWSPDMAYWLGYIYADGCLGSEGLYLLCQESDKQLILDLRKTLNSKHSVQKTPVTQASGRVTWRTSCYITSRKIRHSLKRHGIIAAKSQNDHPFPNVPDEYFADFVRGYFDGDGSVGFGTYNRKRKLWFNILGQPSFLETLRQKLVERWNLSSDVACRKCNEGEVWSVTWSTEEDLSKLFSFLYAGDGPRLARKYKKFKQISA